MALIQVQDICNEEDYAEQTILTQERGNVAMATFQYGFPITRDMIRSTRCHLGWSREGLARQAGISVAALQNIEKGANGPSADTLEKLVRAVNAERVVFVEGGVRKVLLFRGDVNAAETHRLKDSQPDPAVPVAYADRDPKALPN